MPGNHDSSGEIHPPEPLVSELIDRCAPAYLPQVQGIAVHPLADVIEAEMAEGRLSSADEGRSTVDIVLPQSEPDY